MGFWNTYWNFETAWHTGSTARHARRTAAASRKTNQLLAQQNTMLADHQRREHDYRYAVDPQYRAWCDQQAMLAAQAAAQAAAQYRSTTRRIATVIFALAVGVPLLVFLPVVLLAALLGL